MIKVNIVFDDLFDDADIIAIPDEVSSRIEEIGQEFLHWIPTAEDPEYWALITGRKCNIAETDGFIKWMNTTSYNFFTWKGNVYRLAVKFSLHVNVFKLLRLNIKKLCMGCCAS